MFGRGGYGKAGGRGDKVGEGGGKVGLIPYV